MRDRKLEIIQTLEEREGEVSFAVNPSNNVIFFRGHSVVVCLVTMNIPVVWVCTWRRTEETNKEECLPRKCSIFRPVRKIAKSDY